MKKLLAISLILFFMAAEASAQTLHDRIQGQRIRQGFSSGQLTSPEALELRRDLFRYRQLQSRARRDGFVTPMERKQLRRMKMHQRREASRFRHNNRYRVI